MYGADQLRESQYTASTSLNYKGVTTTASKMLQALGGTLLVGEQEH